MNEQGNHGELQDKHETELLNEEETMEEIGVAIVWQQFVVRLRIVPAPPENASVHCFIGNSFLAANR
jgi:hypothetical protein